MNFDQIFYYILIMTRDEIKLLKRLDFDRPICRYETALIDDEAPGGKYQPIAIVFGPKLLLYDYSVTAEHYIRSRIITFKTLEYTFIRESDVLTNVIPLDSLSLDQAQQIIDRNSCMFNKINSIAQENELIKQIDLCS